MPRRLAAPLIMLALCAAAGVTVAGSGDAPPQHALPPAPGDGQVVVGLCDGKTTAVMRVEPGQQPSREQAQAVADQLMPEWRRKNPQALWDDAPQLAQAQPGGARTAQPGADVELQRQGASEPARQGAAEGAPQAGARIAGGAPGERAAQGETAGQAGGMLNPSYAHPHPHPQRHRREDLDAVALALNTRPRKILGWRTPAEALDEHLLSIQQAVLRRPVEFTQYTSFAFGRRCALMGVRPSMGSVGDVYDNAMCESFFATLECELLDRQRFPTQAAAPVTAQFATERRRQADVYVFALHAVSCSHLDDDRATSGPRRRRSAARTVPNSPVGVRTRHHGQDVF